MKSNVNYMALLTVLLLMSQPVGILAADQKTSDNKVSTSSEQESSSESTSKEETSKTDSQENKNDNAKEENDSEKIIAEKKFSYVSKEYSDSNGRILGNYPEIDDMTELNNKIRDDIETAVSELNLDSYDSNVVTFNVQDDIKPGFVEIYVKVENGNSSSDLKYYVYKPDNSWTNSESEYEETIKKLEEKKSEEDKEKKDNEKDNGSTEERSVDSESAEQTEKPEKLTMVPLRANAEKLGWKVEWEQKTATEPSKAILTKGNYMIKILVDPNTNYDLVINRDTTKTFIEPAKLSKPAELQDEVLYVPSTFIQRLTKEKEDRLNKSDTKDTVKDKKDKEKEINDRDKKDKPPVKPENRDKREDKGVKLSGDSETE